VAADNQLTAAEAVFAELFDQAAPEGIALPEVPPLDLAAAAEFARVLDASPLVADARRQAEAAAAEARAAAAAVLPSISLDLSVRRRDLGSAAADLVQLVAVGLTTDQSVDEAVRFALSIDRGQDFELFRHEIAAAPLRGLTVWEALDRLGHDLDLRELRDLATAVERQGLEGVSITATVTAMATALRERALDRLERDADRANAALAGPTLCFVVTTLVFLAYPLAVRIGEAFGG
jgi:hypothetical protein